MDIYLLFKINIHDLILPLFLFCIRPRDISLFCMQRSYFFYKNSQDYKFFILYKNIALIFLLLQLVTAYIPISLIIFNEKIESTLSAIAIGYLVSCHFYNITTVKDKKSLDNNALMEIKNIALFKTIFEGIEYEIKNSPCSCEEVFFIFNKKCIYNCKWKVDEKCHYKNYLIFYMNYIERILNKSILIISTCKPEIISPFSVALGAVYEVKFVLEYAPKFSTKYFDGVVKAHNFFMKEDESGEKNLYIDAEELKKEYLKYYRESLEEVKVGKFSRLIELAYK